MKKEQKETAESPGFTYLHIRRLFSFFPPEGRQDIAAIFLLGGKLWMC